MNETMSSGSPEMPDYTKMQPGALVALYTLEHQKVASELGHPGDESYTPEVAEIIEKADELYQLGLMEQGQKQKIKYIEAFQKLQEVEHLN